MSAQIKRDGPKLGQNSYLGKIVLFHGLKSDLIRVHLSRTSLLPVR
jgi:hypothetical protein